MKKILIILLSTVGLFGCVRKKSAEEKFWDWFSDHSQKISAVEDLSDTRLQKLLDPLSKHLHDYCEGLVFEIGYDKETKIFELAVSADGNKALFPAVERLVYAAPPVGQWKITAFRQPKGRNYTLQYNGYHFDSDKVFFIPINDADNSVPIDIEVVYSDYEEENRNTFLGGTFLLLDALLGEKSTELDLAYINVSKQSDIVGDCKYYSLSMLKNYIDSRKQQID